MEIEIQKLAALSMIRIPESETTRVAEEIRQVLTLADKLPPMCEGKIPFIMAELSDLREDVPCAASETEQLLSQSNYAKDSFVQIARIIGESC